ncbi:hypothetical protein BDR03DRAFT_971743 [Suillus americanus]|nr:hypothetical protein BDR03DRAFT_971743 [Suillus americanus]
MKASSCENAALKLLEFRMRRANGETLQRGKLRLRNRSRIRNYYTRRTLLRAAHSLKPNVAQPSSQPQLADSLSSTTPAVDTTIASASTPSRPDAKIRQAGLWTRFWLFIGCLSPEYTDNHH